MIKKIVFSILVLGLFGGGFFYWWDSQKDVRELNKTLPDGVRVEKSLFGEEYKVVNKIDGYEFKVPREWRGVGEIYYTPEKSENGYVAVGIELKGMGGESIIVVINKFKADSLGSNLKQWAETNFKTFGLIGDFTEDKVGNFDIVKTQEGVHLGGMFVYFFKKDNAIYAIVNGSEEFIKYIIFNGKW